jgi:CheY-like chemotaxis protein
VKDGRAALNEFISDSFAQLTTDSENDIDDESIAKLKSSYDCIVIQKDLPLADAFEITSQIRQQEKKLRNKLSSLASKSGSSPIKNQYISIILYFAAIESKDLQFFCRSWSASSLSPLCGDLLD